LPFANGLDLIFCELLFKPIGNPNIILSNFDVSLNKAINEDEVQTETLRREGQFLEKQSTLFLTKERVKTHLNKHDVMAYSYLPKLSEFVAIEEKVYSVGEDLITYHDDRNALVTDLKAWLETKAVIFTYRGDEERENLVHFLKDNGLKYTDTFKKDEVIWCVSKNVPASPSAK